jgi:DNA-binding MarR family transcriptional regulator
MGNANSGRKPDLERHRQIVALREQGLSMSAIGRRLGISRQAVADMLARIQEAGQARRRRTTTDRSG